MLHVHQYNAGVVEPGVASGSVANKAEKVDDFDARPTDKEPNANDQHHQQGTLNDVA